jgi:tetratricopeptide (TPR) repeat protein
MIRKLQFPVYILILILSFFLQSCTKTQTDISTKKTNRVQINHFLELGYKHHENLQLDSSYYYFNKAKYAAEIKKDTSAIIHSLGWMAEIQRSQGDYTGSEATSIEALPFLENTTKYLHGKTNIYIGLGNNYLITSDNDNAIYYYKKAINSKTDEEIKSDIINNISLAYTEKGKYRKAIQILLPLTIKKEFKNNPYALARIIDNLGYAYDKSGNSKALFYLSKGLKIREQIKDNWGLLSSYYNLAEHYKTKNLTLSSKYALLAYKKATAVKAVDDRLNCLKLLIQNTSGDELKKYSLTYLHINDSITKVRQKAKNQFAKIKYDFKREKEENIKLKSQKKLQLEQQENRNQILYFGLVLFIILIVSIANYLVAKNKREKIKASYNTETRISKKLHDELANDVYQTMAFAETQDLSTTENKEILISSLDTIYIRTRNISRENSNIDTGLAFISHLKDMMSGFNTPLVNVLINGVDTIKWTELENHKKIIVYRVVQELLVNMKKHSKCSLVVLTFKKNENKLQIDYTDNGVGIGNSELISKNGLLNVENRIHAIKGTITFDTKSNKGFRVSLDFPI